EYITSANNWAEDAKILIEDYRAYDRTGDQAHLDAAIQRIYTTDTPLQDVMAEKGEALDNYLVEGMNNERAKIEKSVQTTLFAVIAAMGVGTVIVVMFALALIKSITEPTALVHKALIGFSEGNLNIPVDFESKNELGDMCEALRTSQTVLNGMITDVDYLLGEMARGNFDINSRNEKVYVGALEAVLTSIRKINHNLSDTLSQISLSAEQVSAGSEQVSTGAQALAQGATEQASAVEELSATIAEISTNAQNNARNSENAMGHSRDAGAQVTESARYMEEMVVAMQKISDSSEEIGKIIATIENIAFQTNILALNAAVEAARAGSAGKGFAVVADEVRNLANKSDEAAKATKVLIDNSISSVQEGNEIVKRVAASLERTVSASEQVLSSIEMIAKATEEESEAISQVTEGIDQISSVVQTNSATSEQSAAASEELSSQATIMKELMAKFRLRSSDDSYSVRSVEPTYTASAPVDDYSAPAANAFSKY
ncbi:MAG: methyl-accepting chemotaxis protein, partial [Clostridia bacterium]|nr:methyl-accepting chemotaxis protein [Clostridia bacterium]